MPYPKSIVITGASSGIGAALVKLYAAPGVHLWLTGRDAKRLKEVAEACQALGANVDIALLDVRDANTLKTWLLAADKTKPIDLVIANAGVSAGTGGGTETEEQSRNIFAVNVEGVLNTIYPLLEPMKIRKKGQIAIMSSQAGFHGFPGAPAYCASKAAVRVYGEGLRGLLASEGIKVSVICPGFIETPMTVINRFPMPFLMPVARAAQIIQAGLAKNKPRISFPWPMVAFIRFLTILPASWTLRLVSFLPYRKS